MIFSYTWNSYLHYLSYKRKRSLFVMLTHQPTFFLNHKLFNVSAIWIIIPLADFILGLMLAFLSFLYKEKSRWRSLSFPSISQCYAVYFLCPSKAITPQELCREDFICLPSSQSGWHSPGICFPFASSNRTQHTV